MVTFARGEQQRQFHWGHGPMEGVSTHVASSVAVYVAFLKVNSAIFDVHAATLQHVLAFMRLIHGGHGPKGGVHMDQWGPWTNGGRRKLVHA